MTSLRVALLSPVVCRGPGLPFSRVARFSGPLARLEEDRAALWAELDDPLVIDAFATMNPQALGNLLATKRGKRHEQKRNADLRRDERTLFMFLSRFATRNDTTGAAGSTFWGRFTRDEVGARVTEGPRRYARRAVLVSPRRAAWLWQRALELGLWPTATVLRNPRFRLTTDGAWDTQTQGLIPLEPSLLRLAETAPGQLAGSLEQEPLFALLEQGVLRLSVRGGDDALEALHAAVQGGATPASFRSGVERLEQLRAALRDSPGVSSIELMREAEAVVRSLAPLAALDLGAALAKVTQAILENPESGARLFTSARFELLEHGVLDTRDDREVPLDQSVLECLRFARTPVPTRALAERFEAETLRVLVRDALLLFEGEAPLGPPRSLAGRFASRVKALLRAPLTPSHAEQVRLLRDAWPLEGATQPSGVALGRLTQRLEQAGLEVRTLKTDRSFFFEDTSRDAALVLGTRVQARLERALQPWFRLAGFISWLEEQRLTPLMSALLQPGQGLPLAAFLSQLADARAQRAGQSVEQDLSAIRFEALTPGVVEVSLGATPSEYLAWEERKRLVTVLDLMLSGTEGEGRFVINEAHALSAESLPLVTMFPHAQPDAAVNELLGEGLGERLFGEGLVVPDAAAHSKQSEAILRQLGDARVAVSGHRGPWWPRWLSPVDVAELLVVLGPRGLEVRHQGRAVPYASAELVSGDFCVVGYLPEQLAELAAAAGFAAPGPRSSERRPEIRMGELTLVRASVLIDASGLSALANARGEAALLDEAKRARAELELPRLVFVKLSGKPFWCDLESLFSLEVLAAELRAHQGLVTFSEMSPGPDELWLRFGDGAYTSELRFVGCADGAKCPLPAL